MSFKHKVNVDGSMQMVDNTSGKTAHVVLPFTSTTGGRQKILTATYTVPQEENGAIYYLNATTEFVTTLPAPFLGAEYTFIVKGAPSGASYTVVTGASANIIKGLQLTAEVTAVVAADSGTVDDTITFVDGQAVAGDWCRVISDGTSWFATAASKVVAGITFTQVST